MILKYRMFAVYVWAVLVIIMSLLNAVWLVLHSLDFMTAGVTEFNSFVLSVTFIAAVFLQALTFALLVRKKAEAVQALLDAAN